MRILSLGIAALVGGLAIAAGVQAQDLRTLQAEKAAAENRERGMKMAPALVEGSKVYCTVADARFVTTASSDLEGKKSATDFYELACENNLGYVVGARKDGGYVALDCIETSMKGADGKGNPLRCTLEKNKVPPRGFQPQLDAAGVKCAIGGSARFIGFTDKAALYELTCSKADGLILSVGTPRTATSPIVAIPCLAANKTPVPCTLTKPADSAAFAAAAAEKTAKAVDPAVNRQKGMTMAPAMIAENQIPCKVSEANYMFSAKATVDGKQVESDFVEVACENDLGYVLAHRKDNTFAAYDCITTSSLQDGKPHPLRCQLPGNAKPHEGLTAIVSAGTVPCQVTNAAVAGMTASTTIFEVACANADGQLVVLPKARVGGAPPQFVSCYAQLTSQPCSLTTKEQTVGYILALAAKAPGGCSATEQRFVTRAPTGSRYYEFNCAGKPGIMVEASATGAFVRAIPCAAATKIAGGCKLTGGPAA